eukprot:2975119-Prymnesium_polylepis.1
MGVTWVSHGGHMGRHMGVTWVSHGGDMGVTWGARVRTCTRARSRLRANLGGRWATSSQTAACCSTRSRHLPYRRGCNSSMREECVP